METEETLKAAKKKGDKVTIVIFSGELDKVLAGFNIATAAAAMGMEVRLFFTFWGLNVLRKNGAKNTAKGWMKKMLGMLNKGGTEKLPLSKFHMAGAGTSMLKILMKRHKMPTIDEMLALSKQLNVKMIACTITMDLLGITKDQLREDYIDQYAGAVTYLAEAKDSSVTLFI